MHTHRPLLLLLALLALAAPAHAARVVGVNFNNGDPAGAQAGFTTQGAAWTDVSGTTGSVSLQGAGLSAEWATSNFWQAGSWNDGDGDFSQPTDREISLYRAYLDDGDTPAGGVPADLGVAGDGIGVAVRLSGLAAWLTAEGAEGCRVTVYLSTDADPATFATLSLRAGSALGAPVIDTVTPVRLGGGAFPSATGNITEGSRSFAEFAGTFTQDTVMLTVPSRVGDVRGSVSAVRISAVGTRTTVEVVDAGGGSVTTPGGDTLHYSIGQGHPVGAFDGTPGHLLAGFQNMYVQHPTRDTDGDLVIDENDADDDNDALGDWVELAGTSFNPVTASDPLDADSDNDGATDRSESVAGTNPLDAAMRLRITSILPGSVVTALTVQGRAGVPLKLQAGNSPAGLADTGDVNLTGGSAPWFFTSATVQETRAAENTRVYGLRAGP